MKLVLKISLAVAVISAVLQVAQADPGNGVSLQINECRAIQEDSERLSCYDQIHAAPEVAMQEAAPPPPAAPAPTPTPAPTPVESPGSVSDDFGLPKEEDQYDSIQATVVRCNKGNDYRFYFYLENGQVWRYLGARNLRYRNCNSAATLTEDGLGFSLRMEGEPSLRVKRVR